MTTNRSRGEGSIYLRGRTWWIAYYVGEKQVRESSRSAAEADAVKLLRRRQGDIQTGAYTGPDAERLRFEDLGELVLQDYQVAGHKSAKRAGQAIARLAGTFAGRRAIRLTLSDFMVYVTSREKQGAARATIAYELAILRRGFTIAVNAQLLPKRPPFPTITLRNARQGFFERAELDALLVHLRPELRAVVTFAYLTGWRRREILTLRWDQVDFHAGEVKLLAGTTKNDEARVFPFRAFPALEVLLRAQRADTDTLELVHGPIPWVFHHAGGKPIHDFKHAWAGACKAAGLEGRLLHDFRRSAVRNLERAGVPRSVAMKLTGHKTEHVYLRYAIVAPGDLRDGVAKLAASEQAQLQAQS